MDIITDCIREEQIQWLFALRHEKWHVRGFFFFDPKASEKKNECDDNNTKAKVKGTLERNDKSKDWR